MVASPPGSKKFPEEVLLRPPSYPGKASGGAPPYHPLPPPPPPTRRTSLIVDPPDGKVPALTPEGQARAAAAIPNSGFQDSRNTASWVERGLWERCITRGLPSVMLPGAYNNNYQIVQSPGAVVILAEMIHDARVIPLDQRPHLPSNIRQWMGDSRGRWEGDTLVVDTTNFSEQSIYRGSAERLHLVERFTRVDADMLNYEVTIDDPSVPTVDHFSPCRAGDLSSRAQGTGVTCSGSRERQTGQKKSTSRGGTCASSCLSR